MNEIQSPQVAIAPILRGLIGAAAGAIVGGLVFYFVSLQGLILLAVPGAAVGLGCSWASQIRSLFLAIVSGGLGLVTTIYLQWKVAPFIADDSFSFFVTHLHQLDLSSWVVILLGTALAFVFGWGKSNSR